VDSLNKTVKSGQSMALLPFLHPFDECCRSLIHSDGGVWSSLTVEFWVLFNKWSALVV